MSYWKKIIGFIYSKMDENLFIIITIYIIYTIEPIEPKIF